MKITRKHLRRIIKEELIRITETQMQSTNPITNQATEFPTETSRPYITGTVGPSDLSSNSMHHGEIKNPDQAAKMFTAKEGISADDYDVSCQKEAGGSWSCIARKSSIGPESVYAGESEFGPAGAATT